MKYVEIPLSQGKVAWVDEEDAARVSQYKWYYKRGYAYRNERLPNGKRRSVLMHREILKLSPEDHRILDHIVSTRTWDNRKSNLRFATWSRNAMNRKRRADNKSGVPGVVWYPNYKKWFTYINKQGRRFSLGYFSDKNEAIEARHLAERLLFGLYAPLAEGQTQQA